MKHKGIIKLLILVIGILLTLIILVFIVFDIVSIIEEREYKKEITRLLRNTTIINNKQDKLLEKVLIPFSIEKQNITKLALINFEENPESVYNALELQYLEDQDERGYRVLAYRNDGYIDVYDNETLTLDPEESFGVAGKGAKEHVITKMEDIRFDRDEENNIHISFAFDDVQGRHIYLSIHEGIDRHSTPLNLLAPIGVSSETPEYFPMFWLYDFDFIRTKNLDYKILIDNKIIEPDPFPVPLPIDRQFRNFIRYTFDSRLYSLFETEQTQMKEVILNENNQYIENDIIYQYGNDGGLEFINMDTTYVTFEPSLSLEREQSGAINIVTEDDMGYIKGEYSIKQVDASHARFSLSFIGGWKANAKLLMHKIVVNDKSNFSTWPNKYRYTLDINHNTFEIEGHWENIN